MREYLKCCKKFWEYIWQVKWLDLKIEYYKRVKVPRAEDDVWKRIYQDHIHRFERERISLVDEADNLIYEMQEKGWIK